MTQPATTRLLLTSLMDFTRTAVQNYSFPDPSGSWMDCRVFLHGLPEGQEDETFPFVIVRWLEGEVGSEEDSRTLIKDAVGFFLGVYAPRAQAEAGLLTAELIDVLRRALWKQRIINRRFELIEPIRATAPEMRQQVHQYHLATIETVWSYVWPPKAFDDPALQPTAPPWNEGAGIYAGIKTDSIF